MKSKQFVFAATITAAIAATTLVSWVGNPDTALPQFQMYDTVPGKKALKDFDHELQQIEKAKIEIQKFSEKDMDKLIADMEVTINNMDLDKIKVDMEKMVHSIDIAKIQRDVEESIAKIDIDKMQLELKEIEHKLSPEERKKLKKDLEDARKDIEKAREQMKKELEEAKTKMKSDLEIDKQKIEKEFEDAKKEIEKSREEVKKQKVTIKKEMENAKVDLEKAEKEILGYQEMVYSMEADGLLNTSDDYTIHFDNNKITVNGKELNATQQDKYRKYFNKAEMKIEKKEGKMQIGNFNNK